MFVGHIHDKSPPPPPKYPGRQRQPPSAPIVQNESPPNQLGHLAESTPLQKSKEPTMSATVTAATSEKYWYKSSMSRDVAVNILKNARPGDFIVRDSKSFQGSYGLCVRVERHQVPKSLLESKSSDGDEKTHLVRHFLIDGSPRGVRVAGSDQEPIFASLAALIHQHAHTPLSLPIKLNIPHRDYVQEQNDDQPIGEITANCFYLFESDTEMLTNEAAIERCYQDYLSHNHHESEMFQICPIQVRANSDGLLLTDANRRLFFRKHYSSDQIAHVGYHPKHDQIRRDGKLLKIFGLVAKRSSSNTCVLLVSEHASEADSIIKTLLRVIHHSLSEQKNGIY